MFVGELLANGAAHGPLPINADESLKTIEIWSMGISGS